MGAQAYREQYGLRTRSTCCPRTSTARATTSTSTNAHVIADLIRKMVATRRTRSSSGATARRRREFLYVEDCVDGLVLAAERYDGAEPVNLGTGDEISIRGLAELDRRASPASKARSSGTRRMPNGQPRRTLDTSRAARALRLRGRDAAPGRARAHGRLVPARRPAHAGSNALGCSAAVAAARGRTSAPVAVGSRCGALVADAEESLSEPLVLERVRGRAARARRRLRARRPRSAASRSPPGRLPFGSPPPGSWSRSRSGTTTTRRRTRCCRSWSDSPPTRSLPSARPCSGALRSSPSRGWRRGRRRRCVRHRRTVVPATLAFRSRRSWPLHRVAPHAGPPRLQRSRHSPSSPHSAVASEQRSCRTTPSSQPWTGSASTSGASACSSGCRSPAPSVSRASH